jgi:predicted transcriptional regulator
METDLLKYVLKGLQARKGQWVDISRETGVPYSTLGKIAREEIADPSVRTIETLAKHLLVLSRQEAERVSEAGLAAAGGMH